MHGRGSDQGGRSPVGRWPVGMWFALVGVSAGTVASFALVGWTFTRGLYTGPGTAEPFEFESGTVVIEAEEVPDAAGGVGEGAAGGDEAGLGGLVEPGGVAEIDPSAAEPQAERVPEADQEHSGEEPEGKPDEERGEADEDPPELLPVEDEDRGCGRDEEADESSPVLDWDQDWHSGGADQDWDQGSDQDWDQDWSQGRDRGEDEDDASGLHLAFEELTLPPLD